MTSTPIRPGPPSPQTVQPHGEHAGFREHEAVYRSIFDNSLDAVLLTAPDGRIAVANRACTEMFGYTEDELRDLGREAVVDPSDPRLEAGLAARSRNGQFRGELTMKRKDGTRLEVELSSAVFRDEQGDEWTSMFIRDITARKQEEAERERLVRELDAERRWLQAVLDHVPLGVILFAPSRLLSFNRKAEETLGMTLSADRGSAQYRDRITYRDGTPVPPDQLVSNRVLASGETITGAEFFVERPDGSRVPVLGSAGPIRDDAGGVIGAIGVFQDVSERMRAEEAVRGSERLLNGIFELLPVGVWLADPTGRIVRGNEAGIRIWGGARYVGPSEFGEYRGWWADTGKRIEPEEWALARALNRGETSIGEVIRIQCFDGGYRTIINSALPLYDDHGQATGAIVVNEDITTLKDTEAALRRAVESREHVLEVVAHDLRHPLQVILMLVQALVATGERRPDERALRDIHDQIGRMDRLIQDLLDVSLVESGTLRLERSRLRPEALLDDVWQAHWRAASAASLDLERDVPASALEVSVDREKIGRVFGNLITNAVKFTPPGGRITIGAEPDEGAVRFRVADTGGGIDPDALAHVFDRRWQANADGRGVGLGLAIAKSIVEAHGGRIWAESTLGHGTTIFFTLPAAGPAIGTS